MMHQPNVRVVKSFSQLDRILGWHKMEEPIKQCRQVRRFATKQERRGEQLRINTYLRR